MKHFPDEGDPEWTQINSQTLLFFFCSSANIYCNYAHKCVKMSYTVLLKDGIKVKMTDIQFIWGSLELLEATRTQKSQYKEDTKWAQRRNSHCYVFCLCCFCTVRHEISRCFYFVFCRWSQTFRISRFSRNSAAPVLTFKKMFKSFEMS